MDRCLPALESANSFEHTALKVLGLSESSADVSLLKVAPEMHSGKRARTRISSKKLVE